MLSECPVGRCATIRFILYSAAGFAMFGAFLAIGQRITPGHLFDEGGPVEWVQFVAIGLGSVLLFIQGWRWPPLRALFLFLAVLAAFAAARELDDVLEGLIPWGWKIPAVACAAAAFALWWRDPDRWWAQVTRWVTTPSFALLWVGFMVAVVFAQVFDGQGDFWDAALGGVRSGPFRAAAEELLELIGYLLVLLGVVESFFAAPHVAGEAGAAVRG